MKFAASALLLATLGFAEAGRKISKNAFLRHAIRVDKNGKRRLEDQEEAAITADDSIKFQKCVSITIGPDEDTAEYLFDGYYDYTQAGTLSSTMELAMFSVCDYSYADENGDPYCHYSGDGGGDELYMTPLANWLANTAGVHAEQVESYCQACQEAQDWCQ